MYLFDVQSGHWGGVGNGPRKSIFEYRRIGKRPKPSKVTDRRALFGESGAVGIAGRHNDRVGGRMRTYFQRPDHRQTVAGYFVI
jgi:hypothetical protein